MVQPTCDFGKGSDTKFERLVIRLIEGRGVDEPANSVEERIHSSLNNSDSVSPLFHVSYVTRKAWTCKPNLLHNGYWRLIK